MEQIKVRQNGVSSTKKALLLEKSASKRSLQHKEGSPAGRKYVKTEFAAQKRLSCWKEVRQNGVCSTKKALLLEKSASKRNLQHKKGSPAERKCVKTELAAQRRLSCWKEVHQNGVSSTKKALPLVKSASMQLIEQKNRLSP
ncbi:hypothetical protein H4O14_06435 [Bacillus sp. PAMC26568]|nr:hypothetical protein H4O14_06435 [Bacillus sp. PAMC26568]